MKKLKLGLISLIVLSLLLSACTKETSTVVKEELIKDEPPHEITMFYPSADGVGLDEMLEELNEITKDKINTIVKLKIAPNWYKWESQSNQAIVDGEDIDLILTTSSQLQDRVVKDFLLPLDNLIETKGEAILDVIGSDILKATTINGEIFAVPTVTGWANPTGFYVNKTLLDKYHIDFTKIKTINDFEDVLKKIKASEPNTWLLSDISAEIFMTDYLYDPLGDSIGVLPIDAKDLTVVNLFETAAYKESLLRIHEWYNAGYFHFVEEKSQLYKQRAFATETILEPWLINIYSSWDMDTRVAIEITPPILTVDSFEMNYSILKTSKNPEKAMEFLNLLYTDKDIINLLAWGVEGLDYEKIDENTVRTPDVADSSDLRFQHEWGLYFGNQFLRYTSELLPSTLNEQKADFNERALRSKAFGFRFNPESVQEEVKLLSSMIIRHRNRLESGTLDPEIYLPDFIERLKKAGIDKVIAEKQRQLDEWAALQ